jgi:hypothetical protein
MSVTIILLFLDHQMYFKMQATVYAIANCIN